MSSPETGPLTIAGPDGPLAGELIHVPASPATVIIIPGSGPIDRDGNGPAGINSNTYRLLAEALAQAGISSLRIDKRGLFGSSMAARDPQAVTLSGYAEDVSRWAHAVAGQTGNDKIWLAGHSEGGLVALVAARNQSLPLRGLLLLAAPGRPISLLMREQFALNPTYRPYLDQLERLISTLEAGLYVPVEEIEPALRPFFNSGLQRYMAQLFTYDPAQIARKVSLPALIIQGGRDIQVTRKDAELLAKAMPQAQCAIFSQMTHMLKEDVAGAPLMTYQRPDLPLTPKLAETLCRFIQEHGVR